MKLHLDLKFKKFDPNKRNFTTRVSFIRDVFTNTFSVDDILRKSIEHKLDMTLLDYDQAQERLMKQLLSDDSLAVLNKIRKMENKR